jgi:putative transposase
MSRYIHKSHNVSVLLNHIVFLPLTAAPDELAALTGLGRCPAKYRKSVFTTEVEELLKVVCNEIELRYEFEFLEIGADQDHVHFLVQAVPSYSPTKIVRTIKSITAREIFKRLPKIRQVLWGGEFWMKGYFVAAVGKHGSEGTIWEYVRALGGGEYRRLRLGQASLLEAASE